MAIVLMVKMMMGRIVMMIVNVMLVMKVNEVMMMM
jgi:hypothetical protein